MSVRPIGLPSRRRTAAAIGARLAVILAPVVLAGCQPGVLNPEGPVGAADRTLLLDSLAIMLAIVVPTILAIFGFAWWFRATNRRARYLPEWAYSGQLELIVWAVPVMTIMLLGGVAWVGSHELDPYKPLQSNRAALNVDVVSLDWKWLFIYPQQQVASVNRLVIPTGVPVHFTLTSASVMSAFFIPQLGSMIYTMNGMTTQLNLAADRPGTYYGMSSHYNGDGFSDMHFDVQAVPQDQFQQWVATTSGQGPTLNGQSYAELLKQSVNVAPFTYRSVAGDLFDNIVSQALPPGPGPVPETNPGQVRPDKSAQAEK